LREFDAAAKAASPACEIQHQTSAQHERRAMRAAIATAQDRL
jgi:hypothetical protein